MQKYAEAEDPVLVQVAPFRHGLLEHGPVIKRTINYIHYDAEELKLFGNWFLFHRSDIFHHLLGDKIWW